MFPDIGGVELAIVAVIALLVFKPEDLPMIMKKFGNFVGSAKRMAADFRSSFEDMARQSELDELRKEVQAMKAKATQMVSDPVSGMTDVMTSTADEINRGLAGDGTMDPEFNYTQTEHVPFEDEAPVIEAPPPAPAPAKPPRSKAKPKPAAKGIVSK